MIYRYYRFLDTGQLIRSVRSIILLSVMVMWAPQLYWVTHNLDAIPSYHDDVIKWKHFPRYWLFVREFTGHRWIPRKGQWRGALMFSLICALNKRLSKQSWGWWFKTPSRPLWRHCNAFPVSGISHTISTWHGWAFFLWLFRPLFYYRFLRFMHPYSAVETFKCV